jgi:SAM-dependent methyltransferase
MREDSWDVWWKSAAGQYVLRWEQAQFDAAVSDVFGFHAVQCGAPAVRALRANRMALRVLAGMSAHVNPQEDAVAVQVEMFEELPFETQSLDLVILPHVLEGASDPHQVLREVERVLRPEGRLMVAGLNPVSLWGAHHMAPRWFNQSFLPADTRLIALSRLRDWCKLLSLETQAVRYGCWRPACRSERWLARMRFMEVIGDRWWPICGAVYLVSAIKRVRAVRWVGPAWRTSPRGRALLIANARRTQAPPALGPQDLA